MGRGCIELILQCKTGRQGQHWLCLFVWKLYITYSNLNSGYFRVQSPFCGEVFDSETVG